MKKPSKNLTPGGKLSRRSFLEAGSAAIVGGALAHSLPDENEKKEEAGEETLKIRQYRTLGRTGFKVSDISMGGTRNRDSSVVRYAYDHGVNLFDTAERYVNGESERIISEALKHMDRKKIYISTKIHIGDKDSSETVVERFKKCQERLQTEYIDAFFMHSVDDVSMLGHEGFHAAATRLKTEGRLKHLGVSCHGSRRRQQANSMEEVLCATAEDGRFDLLLVVYNFMNSEPGEKVIAACKKNDVGVLAMKTQPGVLKVVPVDPENLTKEQLRTVERYKGFGMSEEQAIERLKSGVGRQKEAVENSTGTSSWSIPSFPSRARSSPRRTGDSSRITGLLSTDSTAAMPATFARLRAPGTCP
ncbi:MAG: aldo/keto reductase [Planctomycetota bacterium]|jgi:aryl-alcohol dehydrogenase-like predicted oxidoreductase